METVTYRLWKYFSHLILKNILHGHRGIIAPYQTYVLFFVDIERKNSEKECSIGSESVMIAWMIHPITVKPHFSWISQFFKNPQKLVPRKIAK